MTLDELKKADQDIRNGEITDIGRIKELFAQAVAHEEQLKAEINKRYTLKELKSMYRMYSDAKKAEAVNRAYDDFLMSFNLSGSVSYNPFGGESMKDALKKKVEGQTQEELDEYIERRRAAIEERRKALENPETLSEFQTFIRWKGKSALTEEQNERLEQLIADQTLEKQKEEAKSRATVSQVNLDGVGMELKETTHTKKGYDLFVVELSDRVDREVFNELKAKAKRLGGWYSSYRAGGAIPGFQFKEKTAAEQFIALQKGDVDRGNQVEEKMQNKQMTVADRFRASADKMEAEGRDSLSADRKTNTARRVRMAQSAESDAEGKIWFAKVMRNIAQGIEDGEIKYLSLVDSMVQLTELQSLLNRAHYERMRIEEIRYDMWEDAKDDTKSVEYVKYPIPTYHVERLDRIFATIKNTKGIAMRMKRIGKLMIQAKRTGDHLVKVSYRSEIDDLRRIVERVPDRYDQAYIKDELLRLDRIQRMGLVNLPTLKTALREYIQFKKVDVLSPEEQREKEERDLEREFVGKKIEGFFPTPRPLAETMVDLLDIQEGDSVCEPSAGLGHLADVATEENPGIDITLIEQYWPLVEALRKKGYENVVQGDFLEYNERKFDRILMNPPFENLADIDHVRHAYSLLNPDGKLVAIMANNKQGTRQKVREFSEWLDEVGAFVQDNEPGAFQSAFRPTGVNTILVAIDKVEEAQQPIEEETPPAVAVKEPWQMTSAEYEQAVFDGLVDFPKLGTDGGTIQQTVRAYHQTTDPENKELARQEIYRHMDGGHKKTVFDALFREKLPVPDEVVDEYPDLKAALQKQQQPMTTQQAINRPMPIAKGKEITLSLPNGEKRRAQFALVELDNTLASHNHKTFASTPGYPKNDQGENINDRNYEDDKLAQERVREMAKNLDPYQLITTSRTPSGTPIVAGEQFNGEWIVVSGNNRTMSLKLAEREYPDSYEAYEYALEEELPAFGIDPKELNRFGLPFLVRIDYDFPAFQTQELAKYNQSDMKGKRQVDKAIERSNALRENEFCSARIPIMLNNYERMSDFYSDRNAQKEMLDMLIQCNLVTEQSIPEYYEEGYFTSAGKELVESVLAGIVLDKAALKATERDGLKQARRVIVYAIPALMSNNTLKEGSLIKQVNEAILYLNDQKASGLPFDQYINQGALFAEKQYSKEAIYLSRLISMGQRKFKESILSYNQSLRNSGGAALFEDQAVTPTEAFKAYVTDQIPESEAKLIEQHSKPAQQAKTKPDARAQAKLKLAKAKKKKKLKLLQLAA